MPKLRCAIYTRKSSEEGLEQAFNSLDAQREACAAYVLSQKAEGWVLLPTLYDDGGLSGGTLERPAMQQLLEDIDAGLVDQIVVYKIDRLTRSLADFAKIVERLDAAGASFVSVTQSFNTATSMGRLTLNMLLSFAQFEREVTAERIRDKIAASKRRGLWMGGNVPLGYQPDGRTLRIDESEAETVRTLYTLYREHGTIRAVKAEADRRGLRSKRRETGTGRMHGGGPIDRGHIWHILTNPLYAGRIRHRKAVHEGQHPAIITPEVWSGVQAQLQAEAARPRGGRSERATAASALIGKIFDETGDRLTPTHTKTRSGQRLRYYVSHRLIRKNAGNAVPGWRLPAAALEETVATLLRQHLAHPGVPSSIMAEPSSEAIIALRQTLAVLLGDAAEGGGATQAANLSPLVQRITLAPGALSLELDADALAAALQAPSDAIRPETLRIEAPFRMRKRGVETRLVLGAAGQQRIDETLLRNIARAYAWLDRITAGETYDEIAASAGVSKRRIQQMLDLAFLAPDIVAAVVEGRQPIGFTSDWTLRHALPSDWSAQRALITTL